MTPSRTWVAPVLVWGLVTGCVSQAPPAPVTAPSVAPETVEYSSAVRWTATSVEYRASMLQAYQLATLRLLTLSEGRTDDWAVVLDADETLLDNVGYEIERQRLGLGFDDESWLVWCEREAAGLVPGSLDFVRRVRERGGRVAIVTNRPEAAHDATASNLRALGFEYDLLLTQPTGASSDKSPRWAAVRDGTASPDLPPLEILMYVGDNIHDFPGLGQSSTNDDLADVGQRLIVLPNPTYGSWHSNPMP